MSLIAWITIIVWVVVIYLFFHVNILDRVVHHWSDYENLYGQKLCRHPNWLNWAFRCTKEKRAERDKWVNRHEFYEHLEKLSQEDQKFFRVGWRLTEERASILPEDYERWMNV